MRRTQTAKIFVLSPAHCGGVRARQLLGDRARFPLAQQIRQSRGAPLGDVFSFVSGLYFRGKIAYARAFAASPADVLVITPSTGLVRSDRRVRVDDVERFASTTIALDEPDYTGPLARDGTRLERRMHAAAQVVLLGSLATEKYISILGPILGERLCAPTALLGLGDKSRGALLLRAAEERRELEYQPVSQLLQNHRRTRTETDEDPRSCNSSVVPRS